MNDLQKSVKRLAEREREVWQHSGAFLAPILTVAVGLASYAVWRLCT